MHDDEGRSEPLREINRLQSLFDSAFPFFGIGRRKLIAIGRSTHHLDGERAKIVQTAELYSAGVVHLLDPGQERDANAVPELNTVEAKMENLLQHFVAGGVARRIPAGGKR